MLRAALVFQPLYSLLVRSFSTAVRALPLYIYIYIQIYRYIYLTCHFYELRSPSRTSPGNSSSRTVSLILIIVGRERTRPVETRVLALIVTTMHRKPIYRRHNRSVIRRHFSFAIPPFDHTHALARTSCRPLLLAVAYRYCGFRYASDLSTRRACSRSTPEK